ALGGKKDTNPGITSYMHLTPEEVGVYKGKCAELCGASHALMDFKAIVLTQEEIDAWVAVMQEAPVINPDDPDVAAGQEIYTEAACIQCHAIQPNGMSPVAPHMNGFAERTTVAGILPMSEESIKEWIRDPQAVKPGTLMPKIDLSEQE